jgi:hypothetical protein
MKIIKLALDCIGSPPFLGPMVGPSSRAGFWCHANGKSHFYLRYNLRVRNTRQEVICPMYIFVRNCSNLTVQFDLATVYCCPTVFCGPKVPVVLLSLRLTAILRLVANLGWYLAVGCPLPGGGGRRATEE